MWIVERKRLGFLKEDQSFVKILLKSEKIKFKDFKRFKSEFEKRIKDIHTEIVPQYFMKSTIDKVSKSSADIAFLFLAQNDGNGLSVAAVGRNQEGKFLLDKIYESSSEPNIEKKIEIFDSNDIPGFESKLEYYEKRMEKDKLPFKKKRDMGIIHEKIKFEAFLNSVSGENVKVFFGVEKKAIVSDFQNVMLVDDAINLENVDDDEEYAFDRGSGCCPEQ
jgi:hypothetical protein